MTRTDIPTRRPSEIIAFDHNGIAYDGQVSYLMDGTPIEIFLHGGKTGTPVQAVARDSAVAVSLALQFGAPIKTIRAALTRLDDGSAAGPLGQLLDLIVGPQA